MAGKVAKALKITVGAAAGVVAGAGVYYMGRQAGIDEAHDVAALKTVDALASDPASGPPATAVSVPVAQPPFEDTPRPVMQVPPEDVPHVARDRQAYHALINDKARDLRARIAGQAYASVLADGVSDANRQVQAEGVEVVVNEPSAKEPSEDSAVPMTSEPYERIQTALKTSKLFAGEGDDAYKPTPFSMPES